MGQGNPGSQHQTGVTLALAESGTMLLADRGYDADWIRALVRQQGAWANIPPKRNRTEGAMLQSVPLPGSQFGRAALQQDQALTACGNALRQARGQLPCIRPACITPMAAR